MVVSRMKSHLLATLYPGTCAGCGQRGDWLCDQCETDELPLLTSLCCPRCGYPNLSSGCACRTMHPAIVRARAMTVFDGWTAKAIRHLKYDREKARAPFLAERMLPAFAELGAVSSIIPVPLHTRRHAWRGFNQAELLARSIGAHTGVITEMGLSRTVNTETQTHISREDRIANMKDAFELSPGWKPDPSRHYVLLDDVHTTGATLNACAEVLDAAGATAISILAVAFDLQKRELAEYRSLVSAAAGV